MKWFGAEGLGIMILRVKVTSRKTASLYMLIFTVVCLKP